MELYNLISTIGSFIFALGILITIINIAMSLRNGKIAGPDPWKGNTLEWLTPSPPRSTTSTRSRACARSSR
jgi:cytochrome c oxidase subunit 1